MKEDVLGEVIKIEKELNRQFEAEKEKVRTWLEKIINDSEMKISEERNRLEEPFDSAVNKAELDAKNKAEEIVRNSKAKAGTLENLSDDTLTRIISKHINCILPGEQYDSPDVKG